MFKVRTLLLGLALGLVVACLPNPAAALSIYVLDEDHQNNQTVIAAKDHLTNLGHTLVNGGPLTDYTGFDQVWDLRFGAPPGANLGLADIAAMGAYLQGGGRMYLTGEWSLFDDRRNNSLVDWLSAVGAGNVALAGDDAGTQAITVEGQVVNSPNVFVELPVLTSRVVSIDQGFLVTEEAAGGTGTIVGWDFGDIAGSPNARMVVGFDIDIFFEFFSPSLNWTLTDAQNWTEDLVTYLGAAPGAAPVPEPATLLLLGSGLAGLGISVRRRSRRK